MSKLFLKYVTSTSLPSVPSEGKFMIIRGRLFIVSTNFILRKAQLNYCPLHGVNVAPLLLKEKKNMV